MKIKNYLMLFILGALLTQNCLKGQQVTPNEFQQGKNDSTRSVFISSGLGYPNIIYASLGKQLNYEWSVAAKINLYNNKNRESGIYFGTLTYGLKISRFFYKPFLDYLNNIALEVGYYDYRDSNNKYRQQSSLEITLGREDNSENLISMGYQFGFALIATSYSVPFFSPSAKIFLTVNF